MNDQLTKFADELFSAVHGYLARCLEPLRKRMEALEARAPDRGADGKDGIDGAPGMKGIDGRDGKDGDPGRDAALIEPLGAIDPARHYPRGTWAKHAGGLWLARTLTDGMQGWDCVVAGVAALEIDVEGAREVSVKSVLSDGQARVARFVMPSMIYRGVWSSAPYAPGDVVSWEGSMWHCEAATEDRPGTSPGWRLCVKHGRDGKDGLRGTKGDRGGDGRPGHDLTQLDFNGRRS
jgi:hypothetical protein